MKRSTIYDVALMALMGGLAIQATWYGESTAAAIYFVALVFYSRLAGRKP